MSYERPMWVQILVVLVFLACSYLALLGIAAHQENMETRNHHRFVEAQR